MNFTISAVIIFAVSFILSVVCTKIVCRVSKKTGFVAHPRQDRYHRDIIPLGGGIAITGTLLFMTLCGVCLFIFVPEKLISAFFSDAVMVHREGIISKIPEILVVSLCILVLFVTGLLDDIKHLRPLYKLVVQFAVAISAAVFADIRVEFFIENTMITSAMTAVWIVFLINAFNFLDNMDGLSAGIAVIACSVLLFAACIAKQVFVGALGFVFIGTLLGFLVFNFPPAKIFMGDAGSMVIGFLAAVLTLRTTYYQQAQSGLWYPVVLPLITMAVPLYDFISVTLIRLVQGRSPFVGDTQHFSHRLKKIGLNDRQIVLTLYLATLCTGLGATFLYQVDMTAAVLIFAQTILILLIIAILETAGKNND
jgi:UDP-GlcNAc:undecaprenyl-phosphate GlcNAc-1-phosphate transferase